MTTIYGVVSNLEFCFCFCSKILSCHYLTQAVSQPCDSPSAVTAAAHSTWFPVFAGGYGEDVIRKQCICFCGRGLRVCGCQIQIRSQNQSPMDSREKLYIALGQFRWFLCVSVSKKFQILQQQQKMWPLSSSRKGE